MNIVLRTPRMKPEEFFARAEAREEKFECDDFGHVAKTRPNIAHIGIVGNLQARDQPSLDAPHPRH